MSATSEALLVNYVRRPMFERGTQIWVDGAGLDPLRDQSFATLLQITDYETHMVTQFQQARPDLISWLYYQTTELWWVILVYNSIFCALEMVEGTELLIPNQALVTDRLNVARTNNLFNTVVSV